MSEITTVVEKLEATRLSENATKDTTSRYTVKASLSELGHGAGSVSLRFRIELSCIPNIANFVVAGRVMVRGGREEVQALLTREPPNDTPQVLALVYERIYGLVYLMARDLDVPHPMPGLVRQRADPSNA